MNIAQIENNVQSLVKAFGKETFIYDLLLAYGTPKSIIARLQKGSLNLSKTPGEISWKKQLFFKPLAKEALHEVFENLIQQNSATKHSPRFVVVTDYETLLAIDTKTKDRLDTPIADLAKQYDFFLPLAGMEKAQHQAENPADVKAAERMAKLYDEIKKDNPTTTPEEVHNLNVFLSRLLFCFFAEDTGIFPKKSMFTNAISSHTQPDGSDLQHYLGTLFGVLNSEQRSDKLADHYDEFPYVNGGLFAVDIQLPVFTRRSRQAILDSGHEDWSAINPDIFGSMIQAVVSPEHRGSLGMHYTSVPNIIKVIKPLFLDELYEAFEKAKPDATKLKKLLVRIGNIKIFDPACGSGNFLIIAYKELRRLELQTLMALKAPQNQLTGFEDKQTALFGKVQPNLTAVQSGYQINLFSEISLQNFYGIELDDFAHEIAILSLWLAQHQMNVEFKAVTGTALPSLPLKAGGNIVAGNATRLDWKVVCPKKEGDEIYILGNPPFAGKKEQNSSQKDDLKLVFKSVPGNGVLDYVSNWFLLAAKFINKTSSEAAFVSTNSILQGEQVSVLWHELFRNLVKIKFAYKPFVWKNIAKNNASVHVVIVGLTKKENSKKHLFTINQNGSILKRDVQNINPYLLEGNDTAVSKRSNTLSEILPLSYGSMPIDNGELIITEDEKIKIETQFPNASKFIKQITGGFEFINKSLRYCLWASSGDLNEIQKIPPLISKIIRCETYRKTSDRLNTKILAAKPYSFGEIRQPKSNYIIIPKVSSDRREYVPIDFMKSSVIVTGSALFIETEEGFMFSSINSKMFNVWIQCVCGRMKSDPQISSSICYNTFPFPNINEIQKHQLKKYAYRIIEEREHHSEKTLAQLYDPEKMPAGLREAHHQNDLAVERCYRSKPFESDEERLEYLFKLYEQMIAEEKDKGTLFD